MVSFLQKLFGGSESQSQQQSAPVDLTPAEFRPTRGQTANVFRGLLSGGADDPLGGVPSADRPLVAPLGAQEQTILGRLDPLRDIRQTTLRQIIGGEFLPGEGRANPFLEATIQAAQEPTRQALEDTLARTLPGQFTLAGQRTQPGASSPFDIAAARATEGAAARLADIATQISFGAFETERGRQQEGIELGQNEIETTIQELQASALPRLVEDLGIERGLDEFKTRLGAILEALRLATGASAPVVASQSSGTASSTAQRGVTQGASDIGLTFNGIG